ncbi:MAG: SnoaL-like polyketide cyclase [Deltaproteobacteria bacterium]|nr:SnoaL-like polyketide cyclase [Deltaproteobacteria bacterium]
MTEQLQVDTAKSMVKAYADKDWASLWSLADWRITFDEIPTRRKTHGIKRFMTIMQEWGAAFPDSEITIKGMKEMGKTVSFDLRWTGTHEGPIDTPGGTILPTGKKIDLPVIMTVDVGEEKVESVTHIFDMAVMDKQIELTPEERSA